MTQHPLPLNEFAYYVNNKSVRKVFLKGRRLVEYSHEKIPTVYEYYFLNDSGASGYWRSERSMFATPEEAFNSI